MNDLDINEIDGDEIDDNGEEADDESVDGDENIDEYIYCLWKQDFCPVAVLLLRRLSEV